MAALSRAGIRLAIDDFGTGYSSLSYLKKFPINTLKIDRSFVANVNVDADDAAIVSSIIALAGKMGMQTLAEGVESAEHLEVLNQFGCDFVQGFFFSRAIPEDDALCYCPPLAE
jgi:EAL domain-containing protein (putative c-di-GMP-specific phosphodiesterase class I)